MQVKAGLAYTRTTPYSDPTPILIKCESGKSRIESLVKVKDNVDLYTDNSLFRSNAYFD